MARWTETGQVGFGDIGQDGLLRASTLIRLVQAGYAGMFPRFMGGTRAGYFDTHGLQPIASYMAIEREPRPATLDDVLEIRFGVRLGCALGRAGDPRFGGHDGVEVVDSQGNPLGRWVQQWLWTASRSGELLHEPAPGFDIDQAEQLPATPLRPSPPSSSVTGSFRWTLRETDINNHVSASAYLERAENALADAIVDSAPLHHISMWFRRPSFVGDLMASSVEELEDDAYLVELRRTDAEELCATLRMARDP